MIAQLIYSTIVFATCAIHDGPDPVAHWDFSQRNVAGVVLKARLGLDGVFQSTPSFTKDRLGESAVFDGKFSELVIGRSQKAAQAILPAESMTVSAWVAIDQPTKWGSIIGHVQDDGNAERGWYLGYDETTFTFALSTKGGDDGDGKLTVLKGKSNFEKGRFYHVVGVYDGNVMQLYVNGQLEAESSEQSGAILYSPPSPLSIGAFHDTNEFHSLNGRIYEVSLYHIAAKPAWVLQQFERQQDLIALDNKSEASEEPKFLVEPFLQFGTETSMSVVWRTAGNSTGTLLWGEDATCANRIESTSKGEFHSVKIDGLKAETQYFFRAQANVDEKSIQSNVSTFQTASKRGTPIAFAVVSDTQYQPAVSGIIAEQAWARRPNFVLHCGDIVDDGTKEYQWTNEFFASMNVLLSRVPMYPVLGNHEKNAKDYYNYMVLPDPEYYYTFSYGDADFFMIDSNRKVDPESEQYQWLDKSLAASTATWKFVCHHHPPYSSDENDYGDLWNTNKSSRGDNRLRQLVPLYEKHHVDFVWAGHIHSYERTWPIREGKAVEVGGTIYMVTGGAGGGLETPGPYRPFFQNNVRRGHHYTMVHIHGRTLELKAYTLEDVLFDVTKIEKLPK